MWYCKLFRFFRNSLFYSYIVDYKFQYVIKDFNEPHFNENLHCVLVSHYLTRIAEACWFIKKSQMSRKKKRAICLI